MLRNDILGGKRQLKCHEKVAAALLIMQISWQVLLNIST